MAQANDSEWPRLLATADLLLITNAIDVTCFNLNRDAQIEAYVYCSRQGRRTLAGLVLYELSIPTACDGSSA